MEIRSFAFTENHNDPKNGDFNALEKFVSMCLYRGYDFEVMHERTSSVCVAVIVAVFTTKGKEMGIGIKTENMDLKVNPGNDFYDFATLGWRNNNPIPDDYTRYGSFDVLIEENNKRVREIVENDNGKIGLLYKIAMNEEKLNTEKTNPVKPYIDDVNAISDDHALIFECTILAEDGTEELVEVDMDGIL